MVHILERNNNTPKAEGPIFEAEGRQRGEVLGEGAASPFQHLRVEGVGNAVSSASGAPAANARIKSPKTRLVSFWPCQSWIIGGGAIAPVLNPPGYAYARLLAKFHWYLGLCACHRQIVRLSLS